MSGEKAKKYLWCDYEGTVFWDAMPCNTADNS
jgi:hypothetical protein